MLSTRLELRERADDRIGKIVRIRQELTCAGQCDGFGDKVIGADDPFFLQVDRIWM